MYVHVHRDIAECLVLWMGYRKEEATAWVKEADITSHDLLPWSKFNNYLGVHNSLDFVIPQVFPHSTAIISLHC